MTSPDETIKELVAQRDQEVQELRRARAEQMRIIEDRGQRRARALTDSLGDDMATAMRRFERPAAEYAKDATGYIQEVKSTLREPTFAVEVAPTEQRALFSAAGIYALLSPYYARLYNADGTVYWSGYYPGAVDLWDDAVGSGNGWFGTGAAEITVLADWWFYFYPNVSRWYSYTVSVPYHGFYICYADDGFWDSKEAKLSLDLSATGYQYNYKPSTTVNVLYYAGQNIDISNRYDNVYSMYYSDLLGGPDTAYLRATTSLYLYARGDGSHSELNFSDGPANYLGVPSVIVV
jgi:hypothetical protein